MRRRSVQFAAIVALLGIAGMFVQWKYGWTLDDLRRLAAVPSAQPLTRTVSPGESIADAMRDAPPGSEVIVEPGEYREPLTLKDGVRLVSRVPGGATIRLPAAVPDAAEVPAVLARNVSDAEFVGFRVSGDSATPLPVGILVQNSTISIRDVEITGATRVAVEFEGGGTSTLMASDIRDNSGPALIVRDGATPRVSHNSFGRNGRSDRAAAAVIVQRASPTFLSNVFIGMSEASFSGLSDTAAAAIKRDNWFVTTAPTRPSATR